MGRGRGGGGGGVLKPESPGERGAIMQISSCCLGSQHRKTTFCVKKALSAEFNSLGPLCFSLVIVGCRLGSVSICVAALPRMTVQHMGVMVTTHVDCATDPGRQTTVYLQLCLVSSDDTQINPTLPPPRARSKAIQA